MFHSIRTRLTLIFILFFVLIEGIQILFIYFSLNDAFLSQKKSIVLQAFDDINDDQIDHPDILNDTKDVFSDYETTSNLYFCIIDRDSGKVLYSTNNSINKKFSFTDKNDDVYDSETSPQVIYGYNSTNWLVLYRSILTDEHCYNVVIWTCYEGEFNSNILGLTPIFIITLILSCIIGAILAFSFSGHIVRPIKQIDRASQQIAKQDFSVTVPEPKSKDELYRLSQTINQMSAQLKQDMDTLKQMNEQLEKDIAEKSRIDVMRREFLSNVSHELKTPLAILSSYAEMLLTEGEHINQEEYLNVIMDEARHMSQMVGKLLELSRLEHAVETFSLQPVNISDVLFNLLETRQILFQQKKLQLQSQIEPALFIPANDIYISQAFDNYLSNALKYTSENGTVIVSLKKEDTNIIYSVENTCQPISQEDLDNIWESFYKVDKARSADRFMSVGLGLYIVQTITKAHHGMCKVQNTSTGVRFDIIFPLDDLS